jgi:hypothetical protein
MSELRVVFTDLEHDLDVELADKVKVFLTDLRDSVEHVWFAGSPNGAANIDTDEVKGTGQPATGEPTGTEPEVVEPLDDKVAEPASDGPTPVTTGIDPATLGQPGSLA